MSQLEPFRVMQNMARAGFRPQTGLFASGLIPADDKPIGKAIPDSKPGLQVQPGMANMVKIKNILFIAGLGLALTPCLPSQSMGEERMDPRPQDIRENPAADNFEEELDGISAAGEKEYVEKIRSWLKTLPNEQEAAARKILREAHPEIHDLRRAIYDKRMELTALSFGKKTSPETLPRLGQELQYLRRALRAKLENINNRLRTEAGVTMGPLAGEGFWLQPLQRPAGEKENSQVDLHLASSRGAGA